MAVTGVALGLFLITHLAGNFLLIVGPDAFNKYAYALTSTPLIYVAEAGLVFVFGLHVFLAFKLSQENRKARPQQYYMRKKTGLGGNIASSNMIISGLVILIFLVLHLLHFKFGETHYTTVDGVRMRDLHRTVVEYFQNPIGAFWYVLAMGVMIFHLFHGFQSSFQTVGVNSPTYTKWIVRGGHALSYLLGAGFAGLAIWGYLQ